MSTSSIRRSRGPSSGKGKGKAPQSKSTQKQSVMKRLQSELMSFTTAPPPGISAFPSDDSILQWSATITGVKGTAYEELTFNLSIEFPSSYPLTAPTVRFETPIFHPNVDSHGNICLDILKEQWSACYNVSTVLLSIQSLLGEPNPDSPLNAIAADLSRRSADEYKEVVVSKYNEYQATKNKN
uniref:UBC core domain-containing protein n=1 Tax=Paramoeba aestuarina TaxID=180227 RepID=A0A7S4KH06_9EUKA|mmetsp:Transcript_18931/g.29693  ORF Transcript_18931/g.29693 Transcript_18931/m.29693 type:complete len:183 (+) Transcript_18931:147-695(+)